MKKLQSRKYQIFIIWLILVILSFFVKNFETATRNIIIDFFGKVSIIYIGGNVFQKYIERGKNE